MSRLSLSPMEKVFPKLKQLYLEQGGKEYAGEHVYLPECTRRLTTVFKALLLLIVNNWKQLRYPLKINWVNCEMFM